MSQYLIDYFKKRRPIVEKHLKAVGLKSCKKCGFWIGKQFATKRGSCKYNCQ